MLIFDFLAVTFFSIFSFIVAALPYDYGVYICKQIVNFFLFIIPRYKKTAYTNLALVFPEKKFIEREEIYLKSLEVLAKNLYSFCSLPNRTKNELEKLADYTQGVECLKRLRAENPGVGVLLPTLHYGSFELSLHFKVIFDRKVNMLVRSFGMPLFDKWWNTRREKFGAKIFWRKGGFKEMLKHLNNGEDVGIVADQNVKKKHAIFLPLFGIQASTTRSIGLAVVKTECPVVVSGIVEITPNKYELYFEELNTFKNLGLSNDERIEKITLEFHRAIEILVRKSPESWFWIHRRFKTRPNLEDKSLYDN